MGARCCSAGRACLGIAQLGLLAVAFPIEPAPPDPPDKQCPVITSHTTFTHTAVHSAFVTVTFTGLCLPSASGAASITAPKPGSQISTVTTGAGREDGGIDAPPESEATAPPVDGATDGGTGASVPQQSISTTIPEGVATSTDTGIPPGPPAPEQPVPTTLSNGEITTVTPETAPGPGEPVTTTLPDGRTSIILPGGPSQAPSSQQPITSTPPSGKTTTIASGESSWKPSAEETNTEDTAMSVTPAVPTLSLTNSPGTTDGAIAPPAQTGESGEDDEDEDEDDDGGGGIGLPVSVPVPVPVPGSPSIDLPGPPGPPENPPPGGGPPENNIPENSPEPTSDPTTTEGCTTQTATSFIVSCQTLPTPVDGVSVTSCATTASEVVSGCSVEQATSTTVAACSARRPVLVTSHTFEDWDLPRETNAAASSDAETGAGETSAAESSVTETTASEPSTTKSQASDSTPSPKPTPEPTPEPEPEPRRVCKGVGGRPRATVEFIQSLADGEFCETVGSQDTRDEDSGAITRSYFGQGDEGVRLAVDFPPDAKPDRGECEEALGGFLDKCGTGEGLTGGGELEVGDVRYRVEPLAPSDVGPGEPDQPILPGPGGDIL